MPHPGQDGIRRGNLFIYLDTDHPNGLSRGQIRELRELIQLGSVSAPYPRAVGVLTYADFVIGRDLQSEKESPAGHLAPEVVNLVSGDLGDDS